MRAANSTPHVFALVFAAALTTTLAGHAAQAAKFKVLLSFGNHKLGAHPMSPVLIDQAGNLYSTASQGGAKRGGTVVELKRKAGGYKPTTVFRFELGGDGGTQPEGPLIIDTQGNLYGVAENLVFKLSSVVGQKGWQEKLLYTFCSQPNCTDGSDPIGGLTYAGASNGAPYDGASPLYGVTAEGGANNGGTVFQLASSGGQWTETLLYSFCAIGASKCLDGKMPHGGVILDHSGALYGATFEGGGNNVGNDENGAGVAFQLTSAGRSLWSETVIHRFCSMQSCADGANPEGELVADATGRLFGTTLNGLTCKPDKLFGCGTVYQLVQDGADWQETVLYAFCSLADCKDGQSPVAGVTIDADGNLFGTTIFGGGNDQDVNGIGGGVVFKLSGSSYEILHRFCSLSGCTDGEYPTTALGLDSAGALHGTTSLGGSVEVDGGTVFHLVP